MKEKEVFPIATECSANVFCQLRFRNNIPVLEFEEEFDTHGICSEARLLPSVLLLQ